MGEKLSAEQAIFNKYVCLPPPQEINENRKDFFLRGSQR